MKASEKNYLPITFSINMFNPTGNNFLKKFHKNLVATKNKLHLCTAKQKTCNE